jgi:hypothetical protein
MAKIKVTCECGHTAELEDFKLIIDRFGTDWSKTE